MSRWGAAQQVLQIQLDGRHSIDAIHAAGQNFRNIREKDVGQLIVLRRRSGRRASNCAREDRQQLGHERALLGDVGVFVQGDLGRDQRIRAERLGLLLLFGGQPHGNLGCRFGVGAIARHTNLPATQRRRAHASLCTGQRRGVKFAGNGAVSTLAQAVGIGPVAHEGGIATVPHTARFFFHEAGHTWRADGADPTVGAIQRCRCRIIVDRDDLVMADNRAAAR